MHFLAGHFKGEKSGTVPDMKETQVVLVRLVATLFLSRCIRLKHLQGLLQELDKLDKR